MATNAVPDGVRSPPIFHDLGREESEVSPQNDLDWATGQTVRREYSLADLYTAQKSGFDAVSSFYLPRYTDDYVNSLNGFSWTVTAGYHNTCKASRFVYCNLSVAYCRLSSLVANVVVRVWNYAVFYIPVMATAAEKVNRFTLDYFTNPLFPKNVVNGSRRFSFLPTSWERVLGDELVYPNATRRKRVANESAHATPNEVLNRLLENNRDVLDQEGLEFRLDVLRSSTINAFCCPGGQMALFTGLKKLIEKSKINSSTVTLADGSKVKVNLSAVNSRDVMAALMGHEMTHAASHHSMLQIAFRTMNAAIAEGLSHFIVAYQKSRNETYQNKIQHARTLQKGAEKIKIQREIKQINQQYEMQRKGWSNLFGIVNYFLNLLKSRTCEHESDLTSLFLMKRAGYNPLGALYLQELFEQESGSKGSFSVTEYFSTHPLSQTRKTAILGAIDSLSPEDLVDRIQTIEVSAHSRVYDSENSSPAIQFAHNFSNRN